MHHTNSKKIDEGSYMSKPKQKKAIVVGGGITGLVAACQLAARGFAVILFEQHSQLGGRWRKVQLGDYRFDLSPTIRMASIYEQVFHEAKQPLDPELNFTSLDVNSRNFFASGSMLDLTKDVDYLREQFDQFSLEDNEGFVKYLETTHQVYRRLATFIRKHRNLDGKYQLFSPSFLQTCFSISPFQPLDRFHHRFFRDPRLIAVFNRYASVFASSPFEAPAMISLIPFLELNQGVHILEGGGDSYVQSLIRLAARLGVEVKTNCKIDEIVVRNHEVVGVRSEKSHWSADFVISSVDIRTTQSTLLANQRHVKTRRVPTHSEFVCLLGVKKKFPHLHYHNFFFPFDFGREYIDIFEQQEWSLSPSLYVRYSGYYDEQDAGKGSNLSIHLNVPPLAEGQMEEEYTKLYRQYRDNVLYWLEEHWAFKGITKAIEVEKVYGPREWEKMTGAWRGSLYGDAFHGWKGFFRPSLRDPKIKGLYYAGATTFPGSSGPFSIISGIQVSKCVVEDAKKAR